MKQDALQLIGRSQKSLKELLKANFTETIPEILTSKLDVALQNFRLEDNMIDICPSLALPIFSSLFGLFFDLHEVRKRMHDQLVEQCSNAVLAALDECSKNLTDLLHFESENIEYIFRQQAEKDNRNYDKWIMDRCMIIFIYTPINRYDELMRLMRQLEIQFQTAEIKYLRQKLPRHSSLQEMFARYVYPDLIKKVQVKYAHVLEKSIDEYVNRLVFDVNKLYGSDRYVKVE